MVLDHDHDDINTVPLVETPGTQLLPSFEVDINLATPMMRQFLEVKRQYPGVILFYQMGDFYETFFEDALIAARALEITLTGREAGALGKVPMAGVPIRAVDGYLNKLLAKNFRVALCEQLEEEPKQGNPKAAGKSLVSRRVVRVLSRGTITEPTQLKPDENNYLAAIVLSKDPQKIPCGLAFCDITTGSFWVTELSYPQLLGELDRIKPSELLTAGIMHRPPGGVSEFIPNVPAELSQTYQCTALPDSAFEQIQAVQRLCEIFSVNNLSGFGLDNLVMATTAAGLIAYYLKQNFLDSIPRSDRIQRYHLEETVLMSQSSRRNLELLCTAKNQQYEGSLLWVLNQTETSMGARLLRQWVSQPLRQLSEIQSRLDGVEELVNAPEVRYELSKLLPGIYDLERLSNKIVQASASPRDLLALRQSIEKLPALSTLLRGMNTFYLSRLQTFPPELFKLVALIEQSLDESPSLNIKEGGVIKNGYHQELDQLREILQTHQDWLNQYELEERERSGIKTLKISYNNAFGYFIEISRAQAKEVPADYKRKQTLTNAERYTTEPLKHQEALFLDAQARIFQLEYQLFVELRQQLQPYGKLLLDCAQRIAALDALYSLACVAVEQGYQKPVVDESLSLTIQDSRHPVVEKVLPSGRFVPNDCSLSAQYKRDKAPQLVVITGPNMAGKSTYMRQVALIVLMAQMGSFVPASYARIGLVDCLYTRVGAVDDLSSGQSTFMVEMNETAQILNGSTERSLVLLDEVGRGTSTYDGVAIAWSIAEYLVEHTGCRTLFATHYHELSALEATHPAVQNLRVCVMESTDTHGAPKIEFLHKVEPGAAQKSYGIQVARMAGVPNTVVLNAERILNGLQKVQEQVGKSTVLSNMKDPAVLDPADAQLQLF
ncbi:MAG: DNA mismatch repair protein MutS [Cyanobacteria bacterium]|nr:DNA mismatch repair protein MutS [Cyanobacteriota bacterium]